MFVKGAMGPQTSPAFVIDVRDGHAIVLRVISTWPGGLCGVLVDDWRALEAAAFRAIGGNFPGVYSCPEWVLNQNGEKGEEHGVL